MQDKQLGSFRGGGLNTDDAPEEVLLPDVISRQNFRNTGTNGQQQGYLSNIESPTLLAGDLQAGISNGIGASSFEDIRQAVIARYNSSGHNQLLLYDYDTNTYNVIYTDLTDSGGLPLLPLNPQNTVNFILINKTYLVWVARGLEVGYTNLNTLKSGGYGTVLAEDLSLLKPQCQQPITGVYGSDPGQPANYLYGKLPQFACQYVNADYNYSAWSTWSKRIVPYQENTPTLGADVTQNNYIIVSVNIGSIRAKTINIARRFGTEIFAIVKSVDRTYVTALPNTSVNIATEIYEAYNPSTNIYSFAYYNNDVSIPVAGTETDLLYDYIWPANAVEKINGNIIALAALSVGYPRPNTSVTIGAVGYDPNIGIPAGTYPDPLRKTGQFPGTSGSGAGNHKRIMSISIGGTPHTGDKVVIIIADIRNAGAVYNYTYTVPSAQNGNLAAVVNSIAALITNANYVLNGDGTYTLTFIGPSYYGLQVYAIQLFFSGASVSNSIPSVLDNTNYQLALAYYDKFGRPFPIDTNNTFIVSTPSYAQVNGQAIEITWKINTAAAPAGATGFQWVTTKPSVSNLVEVLATPLTYKGSWDSKANSPSLAVNSGTAKVGDTYQITTPCAPIDTAHYTNLGNNVTYDTGKYIVYNGQSWYLLDKEFGDLTTTGNILAFSLNSLNLFNSQYANQGVTTVLSYDFVPGDRCTLHYYIDGTGNKVYINNPCVNLSVYGYDAAHYIVKVEKSATFDASILAGKNVFLRLYSPAPQVQAASTTLNSTVWYEIGERFTITNGLHDTLSGNIFDGGVYYKTRQFADSLLPYANPPIEVLATDFNYSDFYDSEFSSFGRPRAYYDELEQTERQATIVTSQNYILGSKNNGLTRFYPENVYGEADGQTSSSYGEIQVLKQRNDVLIVLQELHVFYIPVNIAYIQLNAQITGTAISEKLLNNGRYNETGNIGIGLAKESFCYRNNTCYFIDPHRSEPMEIGLNGVLPISGKMSKYFKSVIQTAYALGKKLHQYYSNYYEELIVCIQANGGILILYPFSNDNWNPLDSYSIVPGDVTSIPSPAHATVSYNSTTGYAVYTPSANYIGGDTATVTFNPGITKNLCLNWTAGVTTVNNFTFTNVTGQPLSTYILSNFISVTGNNIAVPISITGGQYSINGGAFTSAAGTVNPNDTVQVEVMSSGSNNTATSTTLTISGTSATFTATTLTASSNHYTLSAQYGLTIVSVTNNTATGTPAAFATANLAPGNNVSAAYTAITAGTVNITVSGTPAIPGHVRADLSVGGSVVSSANIPFAGTYSLTFPAGVSDPTLIIISIDTY